MKQRKMIKVLKVFQFYVGQLILVTQYYLGIGITLWRWPNSLNSLAAAGDPRGEGGPAGVWGRCPLGREDEVRALHLPQWGRRGWLPVTLTQRRSPRGWGLALTHRAGLDWHVAITARFEPAWTLYLRFRGGSPKTFGKERGLVRIYKCIQYRTIWISWWLIAILNQSRSYLKPDLKGNSGKEL